MGKYLGTIQHGVQVSEERDRGIKYDGAEYHKQFSIAVSKIHNARHIKRHDGLYGVYQERGIVGGYNRLAILSVNGDLVHVLGDEVLWVDADGLVGIVGAWVNFSEVGGLVEAEIDC